MKVAALAAATSWGLVLVFLLKDGLTGDFRHAFRRLRRDWRFAAGSVLLLAAGIGPVTTIYSAVDTIVFRSQPFADPDSLVHIYQDVPSVGPVISVVGTSFSDYRDIREFSDVFSAVMATSLPSGVEYLGASGIRPATIEFATSNALDVLGLGMTAGRWLDQEADDSGFAGQAVIGHRTWRREFGEDPNVIGRTLPIDGAPVTIIGIGPPELEGSLNGLVTDFWLSVSEARARRPELFDENLPFFYTKARLRDGVSQARAQAAMDNLFERMSAGNPDDELIQLSQGLRVLRVDQVRMHPALDQRFVVPISGFFLTGVGLVLVIACTNLATLLLIRGSTRSREIGARLALGATRAQIVRYLSVESVVLAAAGGIGGYILAASTLRAVTAFQVLPHSVTDFALNFRVLGFTMALTLVTGIAFGLGPALKSARVDVAGMLRGGGASRSSMRDWLAGKNVLVVGQVAISFLLLVAAVFLVQVQMRERQAGPGFAVDGVAILQTDPRYAGYRDDDVHRRALYEELRDRIAGIPGVTPATLAYEAPGAIRRIARLVIDGYEPASGEPWVGVSWDLAGPGYFETLEIPILFGRAFEEHDRENGPPVAVINETMADTYFGRPNAVGRRFRFEETTGPVEVIGVARNLGGRPRPFFYRTYTQADLPERVVLARSTLDASALRREMESQLGIVDPNLPVVLSETMEENLARREGLSRNLIRFLGALAGLSLALASVGLYTVVAFGVTSRSREIGIRMALGARSREVVLLVARHVGVLLGTGVAFGFVFSLYARFLTGRVLVSMTRSDGVGLPLPATTLALVVLMLATVGVLAAWLPARRAARVEPLQVLRHD